MKFIFMNLLRLVTACGYFYCIYLVWTSTASPLMLGSLRLITTLVFFIVGMSLLASIRYENSRH